MANNSSNPNELKLSVTAETSQAKKDFDTLRKGIEQLGKEFGRIKKTAASIKIADEINKAQNPLQKALSFLTKIQKRIDAVTKKREDAFLFGGDVSALDNELKGLRQRQKEIVAGVKESLKSGALHKQELQINRQIRAEQKADFQARVLQNQQEIQQRKELLETEKKLATQQLLGKISDIKSEDRADINRQIIEDKPVKSAADSAQVFIEQYAKAEEALRNFELSLDPLKQKIVAAQQALQEARDRFVEFERAGDKKGVKQAESDIKKLTKQLDKLQNSTKKTTSWWGKLLGRIRNISIYRMIRSALRWITQGVSEGLNAFTQYSEGADESLSNINNSLNQVRNTLSITFAYVLQALEPIITSLADMIVDVINSINLALAKMRGDTYYDKVAKAADRMSESAKKAQKFNFDAFNALSGSDNKTDIKDLYYPEEIEKDENKLSKFFEKIISFISKVGKNISDIISELIDSGSLETIVDVSMEILDIIMKVVGVLTDVIAYLNKIGLLKPLLLGIATAFIAIKAAALGAAIASAAQYIMAHPLVGAAVSAAALAGFIGIAVKLNSMKGYADGGIPAKSELFYMNENGRPEALVNTGGSQTNVINIAQLTEGIRQGFIQAIYDTGLNLLGGGQSTIQVDKDILGRTVAESSGFRNEVNRRNPALNLR